MRAIRTTMFFLIFLSVALAQSTAEHNFKVTNLDLSGNPIDTYQWLTQGCFLADVENQNQFYKRDFEISALFPDGVTITSIEELKNISHTMNSYSQQCSPYTEETVNGTITHQNCTTVPVPYISWYPDYKPAKMHKINGKSSTQKTETINIGKGETKRFRVCVRVPMGSSGKFDVGVYDTNDATLTLLDPWWDSSWRYRTCYNITENSGANLTNYQLNFTVDTATPIAAGKMNITCHDMRWGNNTGEFDFQMEADCNTATTDVWVEIPFLRDNAVTEVCMYYGNPAATDASNATNTFPFYEYFDTQSLGVQPAGWDIIGAASNRNFTINQTVVESGQSAYFNHGAGGVRLVANKSLATPLTNAFIELWYRYPNAGVVTYLLESATETALAYIYQAASLDVLKYNNNGSVVTFYDHSHSTNYKLTIEFRGGTTDTFDITIYNSSLSQLAQVNGVNMTSAMDTFGGIKFFTDTNNVAYTFFDAIRVRNYVSPEPNYTTGSEESTGEFITLTIHNPTASTVYLNNTVLLNYTVTSSIRTTINTTIQLNGTTYLQVNVTNSTPYTLYVNVSRGTQTINVIANTTEKSVSFVTIYSNVTNTSYTTPVYEMTNQTFNATIISPFTISNVQLIWNATQYTPTAQSATSWYRILQLPLVSINNTNISVYWNYTVGAPAPYQNTSDTETQVIVLAYNFNTTSKDKSSYTEGETMTLYSYITNHSTAAALNVYVTFNGSTYNSTYYNFSQNNLVYRTRITIPSVPNDNYTFNFSHNMTIQFGAKQRKTSIADSVLVRRLGVDNCAAYATPFLTLVTYDEETNTVLSNIDYDVYIVWWKDVSVKIRNYSLSASNVTNVTFCVSPATANFTVNMTMSYQDNKEEYSVRSWYYIDKPMSNASKTQRMYLLNASNDYYVAITVTNTYGVEQPGILVKMQRFFYGEGVWREVQVGLSDQAGATSVYLVQYDVPYRFALYDAQTLIRIYTERTVSSSPLSLKTATETVTTYNYWFGVRVGCSFSNSTKILTCAVDDPTGAVTGWRLKVYEVGIVDPEVYCDNVLSGVSGTLTCDVSAYNTTGIFWTVYMTIDGFDYRVVTSSAIISYPTVAFGETGALAALMLVLMAGAIGMWNPAVGMVMVFSGVALGSWAGLFPISPPVLIALAAVVALMIYRMKA